MLANNLMSRLAAIVVGLLVLWLGSRVLADAATRKVQTQPALAQQTVLMHCRLLVGREMMALGKAEFEARDAGCADFIVTAAQARGGVLDAMLMRVDVQAGGEFPLPARTFIFKAERLREKGALAAGAVLAGELRFNHAVTYSESLYRWAF